MPQLSHASPVMGRLIVPLLLCAWLLTQPALAADQYTLADLGAVQPIGMASDAPVVVGEANSHAMRIAPSAQMLPELPGATFSSAVAPTSGGYAGGYSATGPYGLYTHATLWMPDDTAVDLGTLGGPQLFSAIAGLNAALQLAGYADNAAQTRIVAITSRDGRLVELSSWTATGNAWGDAINAVGDIAGNDLTPSGAIHAKLWLAEGGQIDLHTCDSTSSYATGLNNVGQVIANCDTQGQVWLPLTGMLPLPPLPGDTRSDVAGINDAGTEVGRSLLPDPFSHFPLHEAATRWDNGQPTNLNTVVSAPGWQLLRALAINEDGAIMGTGTLNGQDRAWLLTPIRPLTLAQRHQGAKARLAVRLGRRSTARTILGALAQAQQSHR
jgi:hypothetical protein